MFDFLRYLGFGPQGDEISREDLVAFTQRLPDRISVSWTRSDSLIVGRVEAGEFRFMTQGRNPEDFVSMVHDAIYTAYDIPEEYRGYMRIYIPPEHERKKLGDFKVRESVLALSK